MTCSTGFVKPFSQHWKSADVHKHTHPQRESGTHTLQGGGRPRSSRQGLESYRDFILLKTVDNVFSYMVIWLKSILAFLNFVHG